MHSRGQGQKRTEGGNKAEGKAGMAQREGATPGPLAAQKVPGMGTKKRKERETQLQGNSAKLLHPLSLYHHHPHL